MPGESYCLVCGNSEKRRDHKMLDYALLPQFQYQVLNELLLRENNPRNGMSSWSEDLKLLRTLAIPPIHEKVVVIE